jgi:Tfp pilus assembly protein PilN
MIELNLLPDELRKVKKAAPVTFEIKKAVLILPAVFIILICGHIYLAAQNIINGGRLNALGKKWLGMEPQRKELEVFKREFEGFSLDTRAVQELVKKRLAWAQKLNCLSQDLPPGIWFTQMRADQKNFSLQAAVLSL